MLADEFCDARHLPCLLNAHGLGAKDSLLRTNRLLAFVLRACLTLHRLNRMRKGAPLRLLAVGVLAVLLCARGVQAFDMQTTDENEERKAAVLELQHAQDQTIADINAKPVMLRIIILTRS